MAHFELVVETTYTDGQHFRVLSSHSNMADSRQAFVMALPAMEALFGTDRTPTTHHSGMQSTTWESPGEYQADVRLYVSYFDCDLG